MSIDQKNIYNNSTEITGDNSIYSVYNQFIFSNDRKILHKLMYRILLFHRTVHIPGNIVECGVFKGSGVFLWSKLIELYCPFEIKKVVGFDYFDTSFLTELEKDDKAVMTQVFSRCNATNDDISVETLSSKLKDINIPSHKFELVKGDISNTSLEYVRRNPGFRISLLYMDLDLDDPTYNTLVNLWDIILPGGIIVFDEYGYGAWTESNAVDRFVKEYKLHIYKTEVSAPTVYVIKP